MSNAERMRKYIRKYKTKNGKLPTKADMARMLNLTIDQVRFTYKSLRPEFFDSLNNDLSLKQIINNAFNIARA